MRKAFDGLFALALLVATMFALRALSSSIAGPDSDGGAQTFAAVGFVVLAAYVLAELASRIAIPRVTGYIVAGIVAGPQIAGLLNVDVVEDLQVFNTLALALIALEAGLELQLSSLRRVARTLGAILLFKVPLTWLFIGGAFLAASPLLPGAEQLSTEVLIGMALMLGALGHGTSPAVSIAVISELKAKGKLPDVILALAVFKDVVMIVMLAIGMAVTTVMTTEGATLEMAVFTKLGLKVLASIGVGVALGGLIIAYMKWVRWEMVLCLLLLAYGVNDLANVLHLKMLLIFIAAGFTVQNFSSYGHDLHKPLAMLALPVFVVFFTTVGAKLDLGALASVWHIGLILFVARLLAMYLSARGGAWLAGETPRFGNTVWRGFISQAGVALGLLLMAQEAFEGHPLAEPLGRVANMLIALNLLIGPLLLRGALTASQRRKDSLPSNAETPDSSETAPQDATKAVEEIAAVTEIQPSLRLNHDESVGFEGPEDPDLQAIYVSVETTLKRSQESIQARLVTAWHHSALHRLEQAAKTGPNTVSTDALRAYDAQAHLPGVMDDLRALREELRHLPVLVKASLHEHHWELPTTPSWQDRLTAWRLKRRAARGGQRKLYIRHVARTTIEGQLFENLLTFTRQLMQREALMLSQLGDWNARVLRGGTSDDPTDLVQLRDELTERYKELSDQLNAHIDAALASFNRALRLVGTPSLPSKQLRYAQVASAVDRALTRLGQESRQW